VISGKDLDDLKILYNHRPDHPTESDPFVTRLLERVAIARNNHPESTASSYPPEWLLKTEAVYLQVHPWRWAWICYAACAIVLGLTLNWQRNLGAVVGYSLGGAGFLFQIYGFISRMIIAGRPPVTNMYESIIWVSFGAVLFALIMEAIYRSRYFLLAATPFAVAALIFTDLQPTLFDPSIHPLVAVLNNNFWLSIHVLTITLSYGAFALALGMGHVTIFKSLSGATAREMSVLYTYNYRTMQIGVLLIATGTILGGVWANYSWGRFWDWDPKETWALITLLSYLVILHGRLAGWWGGFGLAIGSVLCFQSVVMAWYGVNFVLGTGLHSYGFGTGGLPYAAAFVLCEVSLVIIALWHHRKIKLLA
jgi:cytochrome c-type biogenesis protein CcsB